MLLSCPYCGTSLSSPLKDGIGSCGHCGRPFDTNPYNRILSHCWYIRRNHIVDVEQIIQMGVDEAEALIAFALTYDGDYSHDELLKILDKLGISKDYIAK